jgi:hypothetical protein
VKSWRGLIGRRHLGSLFSCTCRSTTLMKLTIWKVKACEWFSRAGSSSTRLTWSLLVMSMLMKDLYGFHSLLMFLVLAQYHEVACYFGVTSLGKIWFFSHVMSQWILMCAMFLFCFQYRFSNVDYNITGGNRYPVADKSAPVYITVGDGGNQEGLASR